MSIQKQHFVLIGGGLAGMMLAARFLLAGHSVTVFDSQNPNSASRRAAGMFNILTGKKHLKTWKSDELLDSLMTFFEIPHFLSLKKHLILLPIYKPFASVSEYNQVLGKEKTRVEIVENPVMDSVIVNPLGGLKIHGCGWLDMPAFLDDLEDILKDNFPFQIYHALIQAEQIHLPEKKLLFADKTLPFDGLILCQGAEKQLEKLWKLPIIPCKGQTIRIKAAMDLPFILSAGVYILPNGNEHFTVGATYEWDFEETTPTEDGKVQLCAELEALLKIPYEITGHFAGIRPTTHDRRPILGTHPVFSNLHVFGGFGTKGILLAPYFSTILCDYVLGEMQKLGKEYDILRYYHKEKLPLPEGATMREIIRKMGD